MEKLRIAFYSDTFLPAIDGVVISILNFKKGLERKGHKVFVFATGDTKMRPEFSKQGIFISRGFKFKPYPQYKIAMFPYATAPKMFSANVDLVHAHTPFMMGFTGLTLAKMLRKPVVATYHTMITDPAIIDSYYPKSPVVRKLAEKSMWKYTSMFFNSCDKAIAPSHTIERYLHKHNIRNTAIVPNSVDTKEFTPKAKSEFASEMMQKKRGEQIVLYVGRLSREKNVEVLLKAAAEMQKKDKSVRFVIGGAGPAEQYYHSMAKRLRLSNTRFVGMIPHDKLPAVYANADAFCIPSTFETQGIVALEAMSAGKPVIGADALALSELIKSGRNGELFKPGDHKACASALTKVLNNVNSYKKQCIATAEDFSIEKTTDMLLGVYKSVL